MSSSATKKRISSARARYAGERSVCLRKAPDAHAERCGFSPLSQSKTPARHRRQPVGTTYVRKPYERFPSPGGRLFSHFPFGRTSQTDSSHNTPVQYMRDVVISKW